MKGNILLCAWGFLFFSTITVSAQESEKSDGVTEWTLEACVEHAWENSLMMANSEISLEQAEISFKQSQHARYPSLNGSLGAFSNFGRTIDPVTNAFTTTTFLSNSYSLNAGITLYNAGRIRNTIKQSNYDMAAAEQDLAQIRNDIALQVANAYITILFANENLRNANLQLGIAEQQLSQTNRMIEIGSLAENERLDIESQIATREQDVVLRTNELENAYLQLKQVLRLNADYSMTLDIPEDVELIVSDPDLLTYDEVYTTALQTQKNVKAQEYRVQSAEMGVHIAEAGYYPSITLGGSLRSNYSNQARRLTGSENVIREQQVFVDGQPVVIGTSVDIPSFEDNPYFNQLDENLSYGFGLNVNIPIYNNYNTRGNVQRAKLNIESQQIALQQAKDQVRNNVQTALASARSGKRALAAAEKSVIALQASYQNAQRRFELGGINSFDLTSIQNQLQVAENNFTVAKYDYLFRMKVLDFYLGRPIRLN